MYPISKIILHAINGSKKKKLKIVKDLGFKNLSKRIRRLEHLIRTGQCPDSMRDMLPFALGLDSVAIEDAFRETLTQRRKEEEDSRSRKVENERRSFRPHIWIKHELEMPPVGSICIVGIVGIEYWKVLQLPQDIGSKPWSEQFRIVRGKIREHQKGENVDRSMFGRVLGYLYRKTYDDSFLFSTDGSLIEIYSSQSINPDIYVRVGKDKVLGGLLILLPIKLLVELS